MNIQESTKTPKMYHKYETLYEVKSFLRKGLPLSVVRLKNGTYNVIISFGRNCRCKSIKVDFVFECYNSDLEMNHHDIKIEQMNTDMKLEDLDENNIENYLLCLPVKKETKRNDIECNYTFYIIESNWLELNQQNKLIQSKCP